jgi:hypothetical protein
MALLMPLINWLFGGVLQSLLKSWLDYKASTTATKETGFAAAVAADQANLATVAAAEIQIDAMKVQVYGTPTYRIITLLVGVPVALHFSLIFVDTILASQFLYGRPILGVPNPPGQYPTFEWAIIASFFLVHAVNAGTSNVSRWLK